MAECVSIVGTIAGKIAGCLFDPIKSNLSYMLCYRDHMKDLNKEVQELEQAKDDLQITVDEAIRKGDEIRPIVKDWLTRADKNTGEAKTFMEDEKKRTKSCFNGWCPNLKSRYELGKEAKEKAEVIVEIREHRNFPDGVSYSVPAPNVTSKNYHPFESRASILNEIMDALRDDKISMIGVWGMGGVGKTTLVEQVAAQAKQQKLFHNVLMAYVSQTVDLKKIQAQIADALGLKFEEESEPGRAGRLVVRLTKEKNILIILDDLWAGLNLKDVGIPSDHKGLKMVLTSRRRSVLSNEMGTQKNFAVEHLSEEEAWSLFKKEAGESIEKPHLQSTAKQVVQKCGGLPIAIVIVAKALKGKDSITWRDALRQLTRSIETTVEGIESRIFMTLELSYNHLYGDEVKSLFLLCGLLDYGDTPIDNLFKYGVGLNLFQNVNALEEARDRLHTLINNLKASSLLLESNDDAYVRMHDVVREVARAIALNDPHRFVVREDDRFEEWSKTDESKRCTFISLNCRAAHELPQGLVCPELELFLLHSNKPSLEIPNKFFEGMKKLKVLDLSKMHFTTLPSSLRFLANLQTLHLDRCKLEDIAQIGELRKLQVLSLVGSNIHQLPNEMVQLTNLRLLDLNDCEKLEVIPRGILSSLSRLECLGMKSSFIQWVVEDGSNACLSELNHLSRLTTLEVGIPDFKLLPKDMSFRNLTIYTIFIGDLLWFQRDCKTSRTLRLSKVDRSLHLRDGIGKLLNRTEELELKKLKGTRSILYELDKEGFRQLKHLQVKHSPEIQSIIDSKDQCDPQHSAFPLLESMILFDLIGLKEICHCPIPVKSFDNLKTLDVGRCHGLKFLFLLSTARGLVQLEKIKIRECNVIQQIISYERETEIKEDDHVGTDLQLFSKLQSLKLLRLPKLMNFGCFSSKLETTSQGTCSQGNLGTHMPFFSSQVSFPNLMVLELYDLPKLKEIWYHQLPLSSFYNLQIVTVKECPCLLNLIPSHLIKSFQNLKNITVSKCEVLEHVFELPGFDENIKILPKLETLWLRELPMLKYIICNEDNNESMKCLFSPPKLMDFHNLKYLSIIDCGIEDKDHRRINTPKCIYINECGIADKDQRHVNIPIENVVLFCEKVSFPNLEELHLDDLPKLKKIWHHQLSLGSFCNLQILRVHNCPHLSNLIPSHVVQMLVNLKEILVENCEVLEHVFDLQGLDEDIGILPKLEILELQDLPMLPHLSGLCLIVQNLRTLSITSCKMMKEIVTNEGREKMDEIVFTKLKDLKLHDLSSLTSFCSTSCSFQFLSLKSIEVRNCPKMKFFCEGSLRTPMLRKVNDESWEGDLTNTICNWDIEKSASLSEEDFSALQRNLSL